MLLRMLADIPRTEFESGLGWAEWALPDQLTSAVVGALLKISGTPKEERSIDEHAVRERVVIGIASFIAALGDRAQTKDGASRPRLIKTETSCSSADRRGSRAASLPSQPRTS